LSKVESEKLVIEETAFPSATLFNDIFELLKLKADEKGIALSLEGLSTIPCCILSDPCRIRQILLNVISNAIKFTDKGEVRISLSMQGDLVRVLVKDSGVGISNVDADFLFQPFVQADASTTRRFGGTGLGLFLSRRLARMLGGDVRLIRSEAGRGSEFEITFRVKIIESSPALLPCGQGSSVPNVRSLTGRVLVIDDSPDNLALVEAFLGHSQIHVDTAQSGPEGIQMALKCPYDLILLDIQMPVMDGYEAVKVLKESGYLGPVVALTAHAMKGFRERCLESGFSDYLGKPLSWTNLTQILVKFLPQIEPHHLHHPPADPSLRLS
jgi:CheY-like chemotaxis protein/anti-sigma regulatory factor (Ser/Thr protein kinase)